MPIQWCGSLGNGMGGRIEIVAAVSRIYDSVEQHLIIRIVVNDIDIRGVYDE